MWRSNSSVFPNLVPLVLLIAASWLLAVTAAAEEEPVISTDRPDFVEASTTVGKGRFQFETSAVYERDEEGGSRATLWTTPTLFRYGVAERWELRLETEGYSRSRETPAGSSSTTSEGFADVSLGVKWHALEEGPGLRRPAVGWLFHADVDSGSGEFSENGVRPSVRVVGEWSLPHDLGLGLMPGVVYDRDETGRFLAGIFGIVLGKGWTSEFSSFVEISFLQIAPDDHGGNIVTYNIGAAYLLRRNWQVDSALLLGANDDSPDFAWTVGLSGLF